MFYDLMSLKNQNWLLQVSVACCEEMGICELLGHYLDLFKVLESDGNF